jgi:hypothetical protein
MQIDFTTPALLFSTISLLLLAYTNRFLGIASIIRKLHADHIQAPNEVYVEEIRNLRRRIYLIRDMQTLGVCSLFACTVCMGALFLGWNGLGKQIFVGSLVLMAGSLALSVVEIRMSIGALDVHLKDMEQ